MAHCVALEHHPRRGSNHRAVAEHDAGWADTDAAPTILPAGGVIADFVRAPVSPGAAATN